MTNTFRSVLILCSTAFLAWAMGGCSSSYGSAHNGVLVPNASTPAIWDGPKLRGAAPIHENSDRNEFRASASINEIVPVQQRTNVWCWAACAEMVHRYYGYDVTQEDIVAQVKDGLVGATGGPSVEPATKRELMLALNPDLKNYFAKVGTAKAVEVLLQQRLTQGDLNVTELFNARRKYASNNSDLLVDALLRGDPAILVLTWGEDETDADLTEGALAHAYVVNGITFRQLPTNPQFARAIAQAWKALTLAVSNLVASNDGGTKTERFVDIETLEYPAHPKHFAIAEISAIDPWEAKFETITGEQIQQRIVYFFTKQTAREILLLEAKALNLDLPPELLDAQKLITEPGT